MEITKWKTLNDVPKTFRVLDGGRLDVSQCNLIYKDLAAKHARKLKAGRIDPNYAEARKEFLGTHQKKQVGNTFVWIKRSGNGAGGDN